MPSSNELALSDLWREIRSSDAGIELAHLLGAARVMAQSLIPTVDVAISGMEYAHTDRATIYVSAKNLNTFPLPGDSVDYFLGLTLHEAGHCLFSPDKQALMSRVMQKLGFKPEVKSLVEILEDLYVDHRISAFPVYRDYLHKYTQMELGKIDQKAIFAPLLGHPIRMEMLNALFFCGISGIIPPDIPLANLEKLAGLMDISHKLAAGSLTREKAIYDAWEILSSLPGKRNEPEKVKYPEQKSPDSSETGSMSTEPDKPNNPPEPSKKYPAKENNDGEPEKGEDEDTGGDDEEKPEEEGDEEPDDDEESTWESPGESPSEQAESESDDDEVELPLQPPDLASILNAPVTKKDKLDSKTAEDVSMAIIERREDLTQMVCALAGKSRFEVITFTPQPEAPLDAIRKKTTEAEENLRRIFQRFRDKRTAYYRGLYSGKLSTRRLYRAGYGDERVFQRKERPEEIDLALCLLMDCSGSMSLHKQFIGEIVVALSDALSKEKAEFMVLGYSYNGSGRVNIARFYDREGGLSLGLDKQLWDSTPTYEAIAAAIAQLLKLGGNRRKILVHYTDGGANTGNTNAIPELLDKARVEKVEDYHLVPPLLLASSLRLFGEGHVRSLEMLENLPHVVEEILSTKLG